MLEVAKNVEYQRTVLYRTDAFEVIAIDWTHASVSEMHDHGFSQCLVLVQAGLFENTVNLGFKTEIQVFEVGQVIQTPIGAKHKMRCLSDTGKTLHVYTPKITQSTFKKFDSILSEGLTQSLHVAEPIMLPQLREILNLIRQQSISTQSPYFMNQLFSGILPQMLMAEELLAQTKTTLATNEASPIFSKIEEEVIHSLCDLIGWDAEHRYGISVPGGSAANFMALHCARQEAQPELKNIGHGGVQFKVYVSSEAHYSMKKACVVLGLGMEALALIPADEKGQMNAKLLSQAIEADQQKGFHPLMVCATAGTTVLGAFDPIMTIAKICKYKNIWLHVDAAWGGPALFNDKLRSFMQGIQDADSVTFDAHKLFGSHVTSSFFLTPHERILFDANDVSGGDYLFHENGFDRGRLSWQCGRRAEALSFWAIWKSVGTKGLSSFVDRLLNIRHQLVEFIRTQPRLELIVNPEFFNVCVRVHPPNGTNLDWSKKVRSTMIQDNQAMVNYSSNQNGTFLRLILAHPFLETQHLIDILNVALEVK